MSLKKIDQIKCDKGFRIWDLLIYLSILIVVAVLFIVFTFGIKKDEIKGIEILFHNQVIATYEFGEKGLEIQNSTQITVTEENDKQLILLFSTDQTQKDYNRIVIDKEHKSVSVSEANCSARKDCVYMEDIVSTNQVIMCTPHFLKIQPIGYEIEEGTIII